MFTWPLAVIESWGRVCETTLCFVKIPMTDGASLLVNYPVFSTESHGIFHQVELTFYTVQ